MNRKKLGYAFTLVACVSLAGGCATDPYQTQNQMNQIKGQTGQVVRETGAHAGRRIGEQTVDSFGSGVTEETCRLMRVEHQERIAEMQRNAKISPDDVGQARVTHQRLESDCDQKAQKTRRNKEFLGGVSENLGRIGGQILNLGIGNVPR